MTILDINPDNLTSIVLQYGILGIAAVLLTYFAWVQWQRLVNKNDMLEEKVDKLQDQMMQLLIEERDRMSELVTANTVALNELRKTILDYIVKNN
jgi:hypothetical protein